MPRRLCHSAGAAAEVGTPLLGPRVHELLTLQAAMIEFDFLPFLLSTIFLVTSGDINPISSRTPYYLQHVTIVSVSQHTLSFVVWLSVPLTCVVSDRKVTALN